MALIELQPMMDDIDFTRCLHSSYGHAFVKDLSLKNASWINTAEIEPASQKIRKCWRENSHPLSEGAIARARSSH